MGDSAADLAVRVERALRRTAEVPHLRLNEWRPEAFHQHLGATLDRFGDLCLKGEHPRLIVATQPRVGKTELVGRSLGPRLMARCKGFSVLYTTSTETRAREASRAARHTVEVLYKAMPTTFAHLKPGRPWTDTEWCTAGGNTWVGTGAGGATGGIGAHLVIMDDVTGSAARARSTAWGDRAWEWLEEDVLSRLMRGGGAIQMETRRGVNDQTGRLRRAYPGLWREAVYACQAERDRPRWDWRAEGEYLCPGLGFDARWREANPHLRGALWARLYQQRPTDEEGSLWRREWLAHRYTVSPGEMARLCDRTAFSVDAASTGGGGDHSVIQWWGWRGPVAHLLGQWRGQWDYTVLRATLQDQIAACRPNAVLVEDTSNGRPLADELARVVPGLIRVPAKGSKSARWLAATPRAQAKQVLLPEPGNCPWVADMIERMVSLDGEGDEVDDEADAWAIADAWHRGSGARTVNVRR